MTSHAGLKLLLPLAWLLLAAGAVHAELALSLGGVQGAGWRAEAVRLHLADAEPPAYRLDLRVGRLQLPDGLGAWSGVTLRCADLRLDGGAYHCPELRLSADTPQGRQQLRGSLRFEDAEHWSVTLHGVQLAAGRWRLEAVADGAWRATLRADGVKPAAALALWPAHGLPDWGWEGRLAAKLDLRGEGLAPQGADLQLTLAEGAWSSPDGLQAGQDLAARVTFRARRRGDTWHGQLSADWDAGQLYADPVYLELDKHPLRLATDLSWPAGGDMLELSATRLALGRLLTGEGGAKVPLTAPLAVDGRLDLALPDLAAAYPVLLQPFGYGRVLGSLETAGSVDLSLILAGGAPRLAVLRLDQVYLADTAGRFGVDALRGGLQWQAAGTPPVSRLRWDGAHLYHIDIGAARTGLLLQGDRVTLAQALELPLLDGRLRIPSLELAGLGGDRPRWRTALDAQQLSLPALSQALGWPSLAGELSVEIPAVAYDQGVLALDGELVARAFDGAVRVTGLQLREPLSPAPVFEAEADLQGLDLERVTRVFDLGRMSGRLDGEVRGLQLVGWQPVAFRALLQSPANDDRPHRISQRAVENLTALGNKGAVALSGTFLRFFESFSYDRLMLKVHLQGQRATLDGIPHPGGGYYLVKGAGLPRIDVIGRNRDVAWRDLVERLKRIQLQGATVR